MHAYGKEDDMVDFAALQQQKIYLAPDKFIEVLSEAKEVVVNEPGYECVVDVIDSEIDIVKRELSKRIETYVFSTWARRGSCK